MHRIQAMILSTALLLACSVAQAHAPGMSHATLREGARELTVALRFDAADWRRLESLPGAGVRVASGDSPLAPLRPARVADDGEHVDVVLAFPAPSGRLRFAFAGFPELAHGHRQYVELRDESGERLADAVLQESAPGVWLD